MYIFERFTRLRVTYSPEFSFNAHCRESPHRYIQIYKKLEDCYDQMTHPQKRRSIKEVLETVLIRILEIKQQLIHFNPRPQNSFVALDEVGGKTAPWHWMR